MNILVLNPILFTPHGQQIPRFTSIKDTMIYGQCMGFVRLGHSVTLAAMSDYRPTVQEQYEFEVLWFDNTLPQLPVSLPLPGALWGYLRHEARHFDMILASETFSLPTLFAAMIAPQQTIVWQELSLHQRKWHRLPSRLWHRLVVPLFYRRVCCVVPRSARARSFISRYCRRVTDQTVNHGINLEHFAATTDKQKQFITIGQLYEQKRIDLVISRFAQFSARHPDDPHRLLIAGSGPLEHELKSLAARLHIEHQVLFLGRIDHATLGRHLSQSLALLVATEQDLNMICVTESVAAGTPVITNRVPNSSHDVQQHRLGIVNDSWDARDMEAVAGDPTYAARCRQLRPTLSCEHTAQQLIDQFAQHRGLATQ